MPRRRDLSRDLATAERRLNQIRARVAEATAAERKRAAKQTDRAKYLVGSFALQRRPLAEWSAAERAELDAWAKRPGDREALGLPPRTVPARLTTMADLLGGG